MDYELAYELEMELKVKAREQRDDMTKRFNEAEHHKTILLETLTNLLVAAKVINPNIPCAPAMLVCIATEYTDYLESENERAKAAK